MGLAFQKLNGNGTVATAQLTELQAINNSITDLKNKISSPDLKAWFKMLCPTLPVIPYYKTFSFSDPNDGTTTTPIGKKIFGEIFLSASLNSLAGSDNSDVGVYLRALYGGATIFHVSAKVRGNDQQNIPEQASKFVGIVDGLKLEKFGSSSCYASGSVVIRGFELPSGFNPATLSELTGENPSVGELVSLATNLGLLITDNDGNIISA